MKDVFSGKSGRVPMYLLLHAKKLVSQKQIVEATGLSKGMVSRIVSQLVNQWIVKRPYRTRLVLEYPEKLLVDWVGQRNISAQKAYFAKNVRALKRVQHTHTLLSGAWLDSGYLKSEFTTVYVKPDFKPSHQMIEGRVGEMKTRVILIPANDPFVFYGQRTIQGQRVVNPFQLYVDVASLGGLALTALEYIAKKHGFPRLLSHG